MTSHPTEKRTIQERLREGIDYLEAEYPTIASELTEAADRIDALEAALNAIVHWANAYPIEVFREPDFAVAQNALEGTSVTLDAMHASWARHITSGIGDIARAALHPSDESLGQEGGGEGE